jgi:hypothetical protein
MLMNVFSASCFYREKVFFYLFRVYSATFPHAPNKLLKSFSKNRLLVHKAPRYAVGGIVK